MKNRVAWIAVGLAAGAFAIEASAAEIPASAAIQSLSIPPILADDVALIYEFPSRAPLEKTQAFALGANDAYSGDGGGASVGLLRSGNRSAAYLICQPLSYPGYDNPLSPMFHAGFGSRIGPVRLGVCVRHLKDLTDNSRTSGSSSYRSESSRRSKNENLELGFGLGLGRLDQTSIDLSLDMVDRRRLAESHEIEIHEDFPGALPHVRESRHRLDIDGPMEPEVALRVSRGGEGYRFLLAGRWTQAFPEVTIFRLQSLDTVVDSLETRNKAYSRRWLVAAAAGRREGERETLLFCSFQRDDSPPVTSRYSTSDVQTSTSKTFTAGLSHRRPIRPHVSLLLGLQGQIRATDVRIEDQAADPEITDVSHEQVTEDTKRFSWGATYTRDRFEITGALYSTLQLYRPFLALDARFFF